MSKADLFARAKVIQTITATERESHQPELNHDPRSCNVWPDLDTDSLNRDTHFEGRESRER